MEELDKTLNYFENNAERMHYNKYLEKGYPIASGVIEGACRSVVKDRMERSGMRWTIKGANAVLALRSIHSSNLWDDFMLFHIEREQRDRFPSLSVDAANDSCVSDLRLVG